MHVARLGAARLPGDHRSPGDRRGDRPTGGGAERTDGHDGSPEPGRPGGRGAFPGRGPGRVGTAGGGVRARRRGELRPGVPPVGRPGVLAGGPVPGGRPGGRGRGAADVPRRVAGPSRLPRGAGPAAGLAGRDRPPEDRGRPRRPFPAYGAGCGPRGARGVRRPRSGRTAGGRAGPRAGDAPNPPWGQGHPRLHSAGHPPAAPLASFLLRNLAQPHADRVGRHRSAGTRRQYGRLPERLLPASENCHRITFTGGPRI
ncbi:hypothetical protein SMICM304S_10783 [Streptomyces microflavus]